MVDVGMGALVTADRSTLLVDVTVVASEKVVIVEGVKVVDECGRGGYSERGDGGRTGQDRTQAELNKARVSHSDPRQC